MQLVLVLMGGTKGSGLPNLRSEEGLGFKVEGLGFKVEGLGFKV